MKPAVYNGIYGLPAFIVIYSGIFQTGASVGTDGISVTSVSTGIYKNITKNERKINKYGWMDAWMDNKEEHPIRI